MIFKSTEDVTKHISVNLNFDLAEIEPSYLQAVDEYAVPAIGRAFYEELDALDYDAATADQQKAIDYLRRTLAPYTYFLYSFVGSVQVGNQGIQETSSQNNQPVRQWVSYDFRKSLIRSGDTALDTFLEWLESAINPISFIYSSVAEMLAGQGNQQKDKYYQITDQSGEEPVISYYQLNADPVTGTIQDYLVVTDLHKFQTWKSSEAYTKTIDLFFNKAGQMKEYCNVSGGRRTYLALRPYIKRVERNFIKPLIGQDLFNQLKAELQAGNLSESNTELLEDYIRPALAPLALMKAIPELSLELSDEGIKFKSFDNGINKRGMPSNEDKSVMYRSLDTDGNSELKNIERFLIENAETYEAFKTAQSWLDYQALQADPTKADPDPNRKIIIL